MCSRVRTGMAITTHGVRSPVALAQLRIFEEEGVDPARVVIGHADSYPVLDHYLAECQRRDLKSVRVIHGKGTGTLRALVHARLRRSPIVVGFAQGDEHSGGWGATLVTLKARNS